MPQDIPLEASETLAFTPPSLAVDLDGVAHPPVFVLRTGTTREKRFHRRLYTEEGLTRHSLESIRAEVLAGLKALWTPEAFEEHSLVITEYWQAGDDFALQKKDDPDLVWDYDTSIEAAVRDLTERVTESWPRLRRMIADNVEFDEVSDPIMVAVVVKSWAGLDAPRQLDRGYITVPCAEAIKDALAKIEREEMLPEGTAWAELVTACLKRMYLDEEEAKNSESPSPSETNQPLSTETTTSAADGKSPAPARSKKTRASA